MMRYKLCIIIIIINSLNSADVPLSNNICSAQIMITITIDYKAYERVEAP